ncbi:MAG: protein-L-isoaspartate(D-aspartate) O-methyltransferase [Saprospiraceae bacterium]|nr:protein-L-isoaspartate(D-aspartate) O-methyltransferase [Saprospiraceae bacterium]
MRKRLVDGIAKKGIKDKAVLEAIMRVPRHFFMELAFQDWAYVDKPFPIGEEQTISQPFTVAYQSAALEIKPREHVLEIGTGSGYQAAILAEMGARVFTVERQEALYLKASKLLEEMGYTNIRTFWRDGWKGLPEYAPFDKIIVTAGAAELPKQLLEQLKVGGIMIIPIGIENQKMHRILKVSESKYKDELLDDFRFVPMLKGRNPKS